MFISNAMVENQYKTKQVRSERQDVDKDKRIKEKE
jgi:hypothetical protein